MTTSFQNFIKNNLHFLIIFILLFFSINSTNYIYIDIFFYLLLHILIFYWLFYDDTKINYLFIFFIGFVLDLSFIHNFGPTRIPIHRVTAAIAGEPAQATPSDKMRGGRKKVSWI